MTMKAPKAKRVLRSTRWFGRHDRDALVHRSWMKNQGFPHDLFDGRPDVSPGEKIGLTIDPAKVHVFDEATGARLSA